MKKSNFMLLIICVIGVLLFGIGMCMSLIPEWHLYTLGIKVGITGLIFLLIAFLSYRKIKYNTIIKITLKGIIKFIVACLGGLALGIGMSFSMVFNQMVLGILIGMIGIVLLLSLIPLCMGLK